MLCFIYYGHKAAVRPRPQNHEGIIMKIPEKIYESYINGQITDKVIGYCVHSCWKQAQNYQIKQYNAFCEEPENNKQIQYYAKRVKHCFALTEQFLSYVEPCCIYRLSPLISGTNKHHYIYIRLYKLDRLSFYFNVEEKDLDTTIPVIDVEEPPAIKKCDREPFSLRFCESVFRVLKENGRYQN